MVWGETLMPLCKCGCQTELPEGRTYVMWHHLKEAREKPLRMHNLRKATVSRKKRRKYKKRDKKYWNPDGTVRKQAASAPPPVVKAAGSKMTDYYIPIELQKELNKINAQLDILIDQISELQLQRDWHITNITDMRRDIDRIKDMLVKEHDVKLRFAGVE